MEVSISHKNLAISGRVAAGTTTLLNNLKPHLEPHGWTFYSGGDFVRQYCREKGLRLEDAESRGDEFTRELDTRITTRFQKEDHIAIESWLAGFNSRDIPGVFKVLLVCPDEAVVIDRVVNRDKVSVDEAKKHIKERTDNNSAKWKRIYGEHDFWDPGMFDLVIDTYKNGPTETLEMVLEALKV